jgi:glycosyltransferase involved in cell wall biosynthesis
MGGAERLMVPYMQYLDKDRYIPRVCVFRERYGNPIAKELNQMGIPVDMLPVKHLRDLTAIPRLVHYLRQHRADLVHTQLEFSNTLGNIAARLLGLPSISTIHTHDNPLKGTKEYRRLKLMWWSMRNFCDQVIAVAEGLRNHYLAISGDSPDKVLTIYNGIDLERFNSHDRAAYARLRVNLGIPLQAPLLITVAVLRQRKGIQYMLETLPSILEAVPDAYYLVVGDGEFRMVLQDYAQRKGINQHVVFTGFREDIPDLMAISDVFVLPTLDEALPTVLAEAMAACRPIIASAVGGIPEMVEDGANGVLIHPKDPAQLAQACIHLLGNLALARRMGEKGWEIANERFNIHKQVHIMGDLYWELLNTAAR